MLLLLLLRLDWPLPLPRSSLLFGRRARKVVLLVVVRRLAIGRNVLLVVSAAAAAAVLLLRLRLRLGRHVWRRVRLAGERLLLVHLNQGSLWPRGINKLTLLSLELVGSGINN